LNDPTGHWVNFAIGAIAGGLLGAGLYLLSESAQDGFDAKEDMRDLLVATGMGMAAGLLIATPGASSIGIGMAGSLLTDHTMNILTDTDFSHGQHALTGAYGGAFGGLLGDVGALFPKQPLVAGGAQAITAVGVTVAPKIALSKMGLSEYTRTELRQDVILESAKVGLGRLANKSSVDLYGEFGADFFSEVFTETGSKMIEYSLKTEPIKKLLGNNNYSSQGEPICRGHSCYLDR
jgi:hypothetical protein